MNPPNPAWVLYGSSTPAAAKSTTVGSAPSSPGFSKSAEIEQKSGDAVPSVSAASARTATAGRSSNSKPRRVLGRGSAGTGRAAGRGGGQSPPVKHQRGDACQLGGRAAAGGRPAVGRGLRHSGGGLPARIGARRCAARESGREVLDRPKPDRLAVGGGERYLVQNSIASSCPNAGSSSQRSTRLSLARRTRSRSTRSPRKKPNTRNGLIGMARDRTQTHRPRRGSKTAASMGGKHNWPIVGGPGHA